jgi:hypothetical protein
MNTMAPTSRGADTRFPRLTVNLGEHKVTFKQTRLVTAECLQQNTTVQYTWKTEFKRIYVSVV